MHVLALYGGSAGMAPLILNSALDEGVVSFMPHLITLGENTTSSHCLNPSVSLDGLEEGTVSCLFKESTQTSK